MSSWITLEEARTNLKMWLEAERAVSTAKATESERTVLREPVSQILRSELSTGETKLPNSSQDKAGGCEVFVSRPLIFKERT